jgi:hypothetical protein
MKLPNSFFRKRSVWGLGLAACAFLFGAADGMAQHYVHGTSATLSNNATGVIRLRNTASEFRNFAPATTNIVNAGVFDVRGNVSGVAFTDGSGSAAGATALGSTAAMRVPGMVRYSSPSAQTVQGRWYNHLDMANAGQKDYLASTVYVSGTYTVAGGSREYGTSTFIYDGTDAQTITAENGTSGNTNRYYNLNLQNAGAKTVAAAQEVRVSEAFTMEASNTATMTINGTLRTENTATQAAGAGAIAVDGNAASLNLGNGASTFSATNNVNLNNGGTLNTSTGAATFSGASTVNNGSFNVVSSGLVTVDATGTLTLANAANAVINVTSGSQVDVAGTFANNFAARTNMNFNDLSTFRYTGAGAQTVVNTVATNPYGNLVVTNASKTVGGDVYVSNNFSAHDNNLPMATNTLFMSDPTASVTYGDGIEVVGRMNRTMASGTPLRFNNEHTIVTITGGTAPATMTFNVQPITAPLQYTATTDVNRKITVDYPGTTPWTATIRAGYKTSDIPAAWTGAGTSENDIRDYEADASAAEKMGTGFAYTRGTTGTVHYVELQGIRSTAGTVDGLADAFFANGNDLLLRSGPTIFYTINNGRWSNPNTWDEGMEPGANDNAVVNHTVHVGYRRDAIDGTTPNGRIREGQAAGTKAALAKNVTISNVAGASLLFGSRSTGAADEQNENINWLIDGVGGLVNNRVGTTVVADNALLTGTYSSATLYDGLINFPTPGTSTLFFPQGLTNNGALSNGGVIEVGQ